jgi:hypothetical protein
MAGGVSQFRSGFGVGTPGVMMLLLTKRLETVFALMPKFVFFGIAVSHSIGGLKLKPR